ncbi:MAG: TVP38/TMEM64 family protein [Desulfobacterales bacterium]|jgi:uncharacterized membrane protein YdjX (TVP38/TMEM64 family)|nr:TVP38/TMEM64 family protein [Desulfobacterales bacterium]
MGKSLTVILVVLLLMSSIFLLLLVPAVRDQLVNAYELLSDREWVKAFVESYGWAAALVFMGLQFGQVIFAPIPGEVTGFLGGYIFGAWSGFALSTIALTIGSMVNFGIGRLLGEGVVQRLASRELYEKFNRLVQFKGVFVIFILYLVPGFPKDYLCMILGLTNLPARVFFVVSTVGRMPGTLALSVQGASIYQKDYTFFLIVTGLSLLFILLGFLYRDPLYRWLERQKKK